MTDEGMEPRAAVLESVRTRIRPIFMTTSTTVLGLMPLVLFPGAGSELYRGLGSVVLGGLVVSTLFTLILVPTLFSLVMDAFGTPEAAPDIGEGAVPTTLKAPAVVDDEPATAVESPTPPSPVTPPADPGAAAESPADPEPADGPETSSPDSEAAAETPDKTDGGEG